MSAGYAENGVGSESGLVGAAIEIDHAAVDPLLIPGRQPAQGVRQGTVYAADCGRDALAGVIAPVAVAKLAGLMTTR